MTFFWTILAIRILYPECDSAWPRPFYRGVFSVCVYINRRKKQLQKISTQSSHSKSSFKSPTMNKLFFVLAIFIVAEIGYVTSQTSSCRQRLQSCIDTYGSMGTDYYVLQDYMNCVMYIDCSTDPEGMRIRQATMDNINYMMSMPHQSSASVRCPLNNFIILIFAAISAAFAARFQ